MVDEYESAGDIEAGGTSVTDDRGTIQTYVAGDVPKAELRNALSQQGSEPEDTVAVRIDHVETESATAGPISTETIDGLVDSPVLRTDVNDGITLFVPVLAFTPQITTKSIQVIIEINGGLVEGDMRIPELLTITITEDVVPDHLDIKTPVDFDIKFSFLEQEDITVPEYREELKKAFAEMPTYDTDESDTTEDPFRDVIEYLLEVTDCFELDVANDGVAVLVNKVCLVPVVPSLIALYPAGRLDESAVV